LALSCKIINKEHCGITWGHEGDDKHYTALPLPVTKQYFCEYINKQLATSEDVVGIVSMAVCRLTFDVVGLLVQRLDEVLTAVGHVKIDENHEHQQ